MIESGFLILLLALIIDQIVGDPPWLWRWVPHPISLFGKAISFGESHLLRDEDEAGRKYRNGAALASVLVIASIVMGLLLQNLFHGFGLAGLMLEVLVVAILLAQKSLFDHAKPVAIALSQGDIERARLAVSAIVGRDPNSLEPTGIARASIETVAENFSDGVVAPAFWYGVFGLPGILAYKMINTLDSMIAYRNDKYLHFGAVAAKLDDLANWLPARLSVILICLGGAFFGGLSSAMRGFEVAIRDAGLHRSPNAGWPEAAMAGVCNLALGGPRKYPNETVQQAFINASGKHELGGEDIMAVLSVFRYACIALAIFVLLLWVFF